MMIIGTTFLGLMVILLYAIFNFDRLVKIEYQRYKEEWIKDGKPIGFFWRTPESSWLSSSFAMEKLTMQWLFKTPHWVNKDPEAMGRLRKLRRLVLFFNIGVIIWAVLSMIINEKHI